jgi:hypothetical protein
MSNLAWINVDLIGIRSAPNVASHHALLLSVKAVVNMGTQLSTARSVASTPTGTTKGTMRKND